MENKNSERDYDKNPIIIKDNNMIFGLIEQIIIILIICFLFILNIDTLNTTSMYWYLLIFVPIYILPGLKFHIQSLGKRYIKITNTEIIFFENKDIIEKLEVTKDMKINKTINDYYHKSQNYDNSNIINFLLGPLLGIVLFFMLIIIKFFYHFKNNRLKDYTFHNAIIIFENDKFINIFPNNDKEYSEIRTFFINKLQHDIAKQEIFQKIIYDFESIGEKK